MRKHDFVECKYESKASWFKAHLYYVCNECDFKVVYYYQISLYQIEDVSYGLNQNSLLIRINKQSSEIPSIEEINEKLYDIDGYDCKNASIGEIMVE